MSDRAERTGALKREGRFTPADYRTWPEDERWELIEGTAYAMSPAPRKSHQDVVLPTVASLVDGVAVGLFDELVLRTGRHKP